MRQQRIISPLWPAKTGKYKRAKEVLEYLLYVYFLPVAYRVLAIFFFIMSLCILYGESTIFVNSEISPIQFMFDKNYGEFGTQIICLIPLTYIVLSTSIPIFEVKFQSSYGLYWHNHTQPASLLYSACFLARLMPVIGYNFLLLAKVKHTEFSSVMNVLAVVPYIGEQYFSYFPIVLALFCLLNLFNVFNKIVAYIGLSQFAFSEMLDPKRKVEGKALLAKARLEKERKIRYESVSNLRSRSYSLLGEYEGACSISSTIV